MMHHSQDNDEEALAASQPLLGEDLNRSSDQSSLVAPKLCPIESLDYEMIENDIFNRDRRTMSKMQKSQYELTKWILCFLLGLIMSVLGFLKNLAVENIAGIKFVATSNFMLDGRYGMAFFVLTASNLGLTMFASSITALIAPMAIGSGMPEVKAYLNGIDAPEILSLKTLFVKIFGNIAAVSASLLVGTSGPMIHIGAAVASLLGQGGSKTYGFTWKWLSYLKNDKDRRDLVTCGAATGMTVAFHAPVGGVLFAVEGMSSWWTTTLLWRAFFVTAVTHVLLLGFKDFCSSGKCGLFGTGGLIMFDMAPDTITFHLSDVPPVLLVGVVGGILGSLFNFFLEKMARNYTQINKKGPAVNISLACFISLFTSCLHFGLPWLASCQPCPSGAGESCPTIGKSGNYKKFQCSFGHYNDLASLIFNTNDNAIRNLYSQNTETEFHRSTLLIFFGACFFLSTVTFGIVIPGGVFVPTIVTGASNGRCMGVLLSSYTNLNQGLFAVLGSAALLGGSMRSAVAICVIILELTNNLYLLPLVMVVVIVSKTVAICFQGIEKVSNVVHILQTTLHNGFPVIDERPYKAPVLCGLILRAHLLVLLKKKAFMSKPVKSRVVAFDQLSSVDFTKPGSGKSDRVEDIVGLTVEEMEMFIDLHLFCSSSPFTVVETTSLAKAFILFREAGLRHMVVIPKSCDMSPVVGILTRHDFMPEHIHHLYKISRV